MKVQVARSVTLIDALGNTVRLPPDVTTLWARRNGEHVVLVHPLGHFRITAQEFLQRCEAGEIVQCGLWDGPRE